MKKKLGLLVIAFIVVVVISEAIIAVISKSHPEQSIYKQWNENGNATQLSFFFLEKTGITPSYIDDIESEIKERKNYISSYSYQEDGVVTGNDREIKVNINYVGGNYFYFHPKNLKYGSNFLHNTVSTVCVLDEELAIKIYGTTDIVGKYISLSNRLYEIIGIFATENENLNGELYVPYNEYPDLPILEYEIVMDNVDISFLQKLQQQAYEYVDNSKRYSRFQVLNNLFRLNDFLFNNNGSSYPLWEKRARLDILKIMIILMVKYVTIACIIIKIAISLHNIKKSER